MLVLANDLGHRRLGVTVSTKVGKAIVRSKVKRRFRDIFRKHRGTLPESVDVVLIARAATAQANYAQLRNDFERAAAQARRRLEQKEARPSVESGR